jgi:type VI secretion system secreted protein VgrG
MVDRSFGKEIHAGVDARSALDAASTGLFGHRADYQLRAGPFVRHELAVVSFDGVEGISRPYSFEIDFLAKVEEPLLEGLIVGKPATFSMRATARVRRVVHGILAWVQPEGARPMDGLRCYRARLVPRFWLLKRRRMSRIFQDKSVREIVDSVLEAALVPRTWRASREYRKRDYCVQYEETDFAFVSRLLAEEGICYYFEHPSSTLDELTGGYGAAAGVAESVASAAGSPDGPIGGVPGTLSAAGFGEAVVFADNNSWPAQGDGGFFGSLDLTADVAGGKLETGHDPSLERGLDSGEGPQLVFRNSQGAMAAGRECVFRFALRRKVRTATVLLSDFNFERPQLKLSAKVTSGRLSGGGKVSPQANYNGHGRLSLGVQAHADLDAAEVGIDPDWMVVYDPAGEDQPDASRTRAIVYLEQLRRKARVGRGESTSHRLVTGYRFTLTEHVVHELNQEYVVTKIKHRGRIPGMKWTEEDDSADPLAVYRNSFECVPADASYRPARPPMTSFRQVLETAIVTGPVGEEIYVDALGRIKVQFHWDLDGKRNENSSCWIRPSQPWAGAAYGFQFLPRIGTEVLVSFLRGDTDRPVILGCLYNGIAPPPYALPTEKTRSGIRTRSSPGPDGYNEIAFEDRRGSEVLAMRAQRDMEIRVENDERVSIGTAFGAADPKGNQSVSVGGDREIVVGGDCAHKIGGCKREVVEESRDSLVLGTDRRTVYGDVFERLEHSLQVRVRGSELHTIGRDGDLEVDGGAFCRVAKDFAVDVGGRHTVDVLDSMGCSIGKHFSVAAGRTVTLDAPEGIRLVCGRSSIELAPDKIVLSASAITIAAEDVISALAKDASVRIEKEKIAIASKTATKIVSGSLALHGKEAAISLASSAAKIAAAQTVTLNSSGGSVAMDANVAIDGALVKINCGGGGSGQFETPAPDKLATSWIEIELVEDVAVDLDPELHEERPVAGARYVVEAGGKRDYAAGVLDANGRARVPIPPGAAKVTFPDYDGEAVDPV